VTLPEGAVLTQRYNAQGRIEALALQEPASRWWHTAIRWVWAEHGTKDLITGIEHSSSRGLRGYQHANGSTVSSSHDQAGRLTQWADGPINTALGFNEHAQLASLKTQAPERPGPTLAAQALRQREQNLSYDPFGRLRQVGEGQDVQQTFDFDANGNRTAQSRKAQGSDTLDQLRFVLAPNSDRLLSVQGSQGNLPQTTRRYEYNAAGEPIRIDSPAGQRTLHYNAIGQIGAVEQDGQLLAHYAYNGARQRVAKKVNQGGQQETTYFTWHAGLLDAELDSQGRVERRVIYFNLRPVALLQYGHSNSSKNTDTTHTTPDSAQRLAIHGDHLGTPQAITDERQRVVWLAHYDAFGRATAQGLPRSEVTAQNRSNRSSERSWIGSAHAAGNSDKPFEFNLRFAGQYEDSETGWHYNWHRFYDPESGRYLTPDPIGLRGGDNAFGYAAGDPFGAVDPNGLAVYLTGHQVLRGFDSWHAALLLIPDDQSAFANREGFRFGGPNDGIANGMWYQVVSAGPASNSLTSPGNLVDEINRSSDLPSNNTVFRRVTTTTPLSYSNICMRNGPTDTELVNYLSRIPSSYLDSVPYGYPSRFSSTGLLPAGTFNSNSYIAGVLQHIGAFSGTPEGQDFPGFIRPLPRTEFILFPLR
jgi:RHS repeat-associated protein